MDDEFESDGIRVSSLRESAEGQVWESHFDHEQADSFREGGNIPPLWARSRGRDTRLIGLHWADHRQAIMVRGDSDLRTVRDLRGRRFGVPRRVNDQIDFWAATTLRTVFAALSLEGLGEDAVEIVDLPVAERYLADLGASHTGSLWTGTRRFRFQQAEILALLDRRVDAIYSSGHRVIELEGLVGARAVADLGAHPDRRVRVTNMNPTVLTASGRLCDEAPELVARYLAQTIRAAEWARSNRSAVTNLMAEEMVTAREAVDAGFAGDVHLALAPELSDAGIQALVSQKDFLLRHGFIEADFSIEEWVDRRPLAMAQAELARRGG